jgi:hypothetical protein
MQTKNMGQVPQMSRAASSFIEYRTMFLRPDRTPCALRDSSGRVQTAVGMSALSKRGERTAALPRRFQSSFLRQRGLASSASVQGRLSTDGVSGERGRTYAVRRDLQSLDLTPPLAKPD